MIVDVSKRCFDEIKGALRRAGYLVVDDRKSGWPLWDEGVIELYGAGFRSKEPLPVCSTGRTKPEDRRLVQDTLDDLEHRMRGDSIECGDSPYDESYVWAMDCLVAAASHRSVMRSNENVVAALLRAYMQAEKDVRIGADGPPPSWLRRLKRTAEAEAEDPEWQKPGHNAWESDG